MTNSEAIPLILEANSHLTWLYDTQLLAEPMQSFAVTFQVLIHEIFDSEVPMFLSDRCETFSARVTTESISFNPLTFYTSLQFSVQNAYRRLNQWCELAGFSMEESVLRLAAHEARHVVQRFRRKEIAWRGRDWWYQFQGIYCPEGLRHIGSSAVDDQELVLTVREHAGPKATKKILRRSMLHERDAEVVALCCVVALRANLGKECIVSLVTH